MRWIDGKKNWKVAKDGTKELDVWDIREEVARMVGRMRRRS